MDQHRPRRDGSGGPEDEQTIPPRFFAWAMWTVFVLVLLLLGSGLPGGFGLPTVALALSTPTPPPTPTAYATPAPRPTLVLPPTPRPTPTAAPTPQPSRYLVANTNGDGAALRSTSSKGGTVIQGWADGSIMLEVGLETTSDGLLWRQVRDPKGNVGYMQALYLNPVP